MNRPTFDHQLAESCAHAFYISTGLGCTVSDTDGKIFFEQGVCFTNCPLCNLAGCSRENCTRSHIYGMLEAERFGGKYIYFCPLGLTCFVSPIIGDEGTAAKITAGPFIMVEKQDFIDCELTENLHLHGKALEEAINALNDIPTISPDKATELSILLFMAVGFMNNVSEENKLLSAGRTESLHGQINEYISQLKTQDVPRGYPIEKERALLYNIAHSEKEQARRQLRELLGTIFLTSGGNLDWIKARGYELMVMISRTAIEKGADIEHTLETNSRYLSTVSGLNSFTDLCSWLSDTMDVFMNNIFGYADTKHANIIHRCIQHIGVSYAEDLTLESTARMVYLSPTYLSRVFKNETGVTFSQYLNNVRITKAKELLLNPTLKLTDISLMVGYSDQSYFTRVFRKNTGITPSDYRKKKLR